MNFKYSRTKLAEYIADAMQSGKADSEIATSVAAFLIDAGKAADLESILRDVQELRASKHGVVELTARSAYPLDASEKALIETVAKGQYPNSREIILHEVRDENVVGGASLSLAQANLDATIRTKLNRLREAVL
jgi:F-type H+-transporting ATPase subunit delta